LIVEQATVEEATLTANEGWKQATRWCLSPLKLRFRFLSHRTWRGSHPSAC